jgi:hypothetical protein
LASLEIGDAETYIGGMSEKPIYSNFPTKAEYSKAYQRWRRATGKVDKAAKAARAREKYATDEKWRRQQLERTLNDKRKRWADPVLKEKDRVRTNARVKERYANDPEFRASLRERQKGWLVSNREYNKERCKKYNEENRGRLLIDGRIRGRKWREDFPEKNKRKCRNRYENNKEYYVEKTRLREHGIKQATPGWLTEEQREAIRNVYRLADKLTKVTGITHSVDHIWPLKGKNSCGLHVPWNLRVIPRDENGRKGNREPSDA